MQQIQLATSDKSQYVQHAPQLIDQLKAADLTLIQELLDYADQVLKSSNESVLRKFLLIRLIKDGVVIKSAKLINSIANHKTLLLELEEICQYEAGSKDDNRGKTLFKNQDPQISAQFLRLCLELVSHLSTAFPSDAKKNPTKFRLTYERLIDKMVHFPEQSDLMLPLKKPSNMTQSNIDGQLEAPVNVPQQIQSTVQLEKKEDKQQSQFQMNNNQEQKNNCMLKLSNFFIKSLLDQLKKSVMDDIDMIHDTLTEGEGEMEYVNDVLDTYSKSFALCSNTFKKQIHEAQQYQDTLNENELQQLLDMQDFTIRYPSIYKEFVAKGSTDSAYKHLQQLVFAMINKVYGKDSGTTPSGGDFQQKKEVNSNEMKQKQEMESRQSQQKEQQIQQQRRDEEDRKKRDEQDRKKREEQDRKKKEEEDRKKRDDERDKRKKEDDRKKQDDEERKRIQFEERRRQDEIKARQLQGQLSDDEQDINQFSSQNRPTGTFNQLHSPIPTQSHVQQSQIQKIDDQYQKIRQTHASVSPPPGGHASNQKFDQYFDAVSQSSISNVQSRVMAKLPLKAHRGRQLQFDDTPFAMLFQYGLSENLMKRWMTCNLRGNGVLMETHELQVGVMCSLQYNLTNQKNYLKMQVFVGNKLQTQIQNLQVNYEGDNQKLIMWIKPEKIDPILDSGKQAKQELILSFKDPSYVCPSMIIDAQADQSRIHFELFLPATLLRFLEFKDIEPGIFRPKWRGKKSQIIKSEMFKLNTQIIKNGLQFKRFLPRLSELIPYQSFMDQKIDYSAEHIKYLNYKLGGVFGLLESNTEYMIKIIVYPNMMSCIQIIPHQTNSKIAEQLINNMMFILAQLD